MLKAFNTRWDGSIEPCLHQNHVFAVRCVSIVPEWLSLVTSSSSAKSYFESRAKRTTNLASISSTNLKELPVPVPPDDEQRQILKAMTSTLLLLVVPIYDGPTWIIRIKRAIGGDWPQIVDATRAKLI